MNLKILLTMVVAGLMVSILCGGFVPVAATQYSGSGSGTTTGLQGLGDISGLVETVVDALDEIFGIFVGSPNLNQMLRNLSAALAVLVQHSLNELVAAGYFALYAGAICLVIPLLPMIVGFLVTFFVIGGIGLLRAVIDALATFTRPY